MISVLATAKPDGGPATDYKITTAMGGQCWRMDITPAHAATLAEDLLLAACRLLARNPRADRHNTRAYIHDLAGMASAWAGETAGDVWTARDALGEAFAKIAEAQKLANADAQAKIDAMGDNCPDFDALHGLAENDLPMQAARAAGYARGLTDALVIVSQMANDCERREAGNG